MIYFDNKQEKIEDVEDVQIQIQKVLEYALREEKVNIPWELSVVFTDNIGIREINKEFRKIDRETDVLSFPLLSYSKDKVYKDLYTDFNFGPEDLAGGYLVLGDIVISLEKAEQQSEEFGHSFMREVCYLAVHSILHLLGYDHMEESEKSKMRKREEEILEKFKMQR